MLVTTATAHPSFARRPLRPRTSASFHPKQRTLKTRTMPAPQELEQATLRDSAASLADVVTVPSLNASAQDAARPLHLRLRLLPEDTQQRVFWANILDSATSLAPATTARQVLVPRPIPTVLCSRSSFGRAILLMKRMSFLPPCN